MALDGTAFLFPGQGAQFVGMARDLVEQDERTRRFLSEAEARLQMPLRQVMLEGPEAALQATETAQPAIVFHSLALLGHLDDRGLTPAAVAGHSLGEFAALVAAGGLSPLDALAAVQARGRAMAAASAPATGMAAVLGLADQVVERLCAESAGAVVAANFNGPGQVVISGTNSGLDAIESALLQAGAKRVVRLPVSAAFHSPLMAPAAEAFGRAWQQVPLEPLSLPQVFNTDARVHASPDDVRPLMVRQLTGPVRWAASVERLAALGIQGFVEIGPRRTLTGLVKKILPSASVANVEDLPSLSAYLGAHA
jgi:[acyl-carrier-protein] S-malonyltransferase